LDVKPEASGLAESELIADANCEPFSSNATRSLFGVEELKNLFQLASISATALDEPPLAAGLDAAGAEVAAAVLGAVEAVEDEEELEPLEQADIAVTSTRPSAGARYARRANGLSRIVTRPLKSPKDSLEVLSLRARQCRPRSPTLASVRNHHRAHSCFSDSRETCDQ
jgi:hypothetical protein